LSKPHLLPEALCVTKTYLETKERKVDVEVANHILESIKRKKVPHDTKKSLSITKEKLDLEEVLAANKVEEVVETCPNISPSSHNPEEAISINFSQENNAREKEYLPVIIPRWANLKSPTFSHYLEHKSPIFPQLHFELWGFRKCHDNAFCQKTGLKITRPYKNIYHMDSRKIRSVGLLRIWKQALNNLQTCLS
jgi:hypothetical protein